MNSSLHLGLDTWKPVSGNCRFVFGTNLHTYNIVQYYNTLNKYEAKVNWMLLAHDKDLNNNYCICRTHFCRSIDVY